eukprot:scaffold543694_cov41-Prasinocladus_malaysianus.AAC.2
MKIETVELVSLACKLACCQFVNNHGCQILTVPSFHIIASCHDDKCYMSITYSRSGCCAGPAAETDLIAPRATHVLPPNDVCRHSRANQSR